MKRPKQPPSNVDRQLSGLAKVRVEAEITNLQRRLELYSIDSEFVDIGMLQSFKSMIDTRRQWLSGLPTSF